MYPAQGVVTEETSATSATTSSRPVAPEMLLQLRTLEAAEQGGVSGFEATTSQVRKCTEENGNPNASPLLLSFSKHLHPRSTANRARHVPDSLAQPRHVTALLVTALLPGHHAWTRTVPVWLDPGSRTEITIGIQVSIPGNWSVSRVQRHLQSDYIEQNRLQLDRVKNVCTHVDATIDREGRGTVE